MSAYLDMQICDSPWHDEGHSSHSTCPACGGKGSRKHVEELRRQQREWFEREAEKWAREQGWIPPSNSQRGSGGVVPWFEVKL